MNKDEVNVAIESAARTLAEDKNFSWISRSAYLERAYYAGLYAGLIAVTDESNLDRLVLRMIAGTMHARSWDDTFAFTQIGRLYRELRGQLQCFSDKMFRCGDNQDALFHDNIEQLNCLIKERDHFWQHHCERSKEFLIELRQIKEELGLNPPSSEFPNQRIWGMLEELERVLRVVALLETDHQRWRIEDS
jgi:hypothetical protein